MNSFTKFNLPEALAKGLQVLQFTQPTPIQEQAIPPALLGQDLIATAQTGTGKTAAFAIPTAISLLKNPQANALVLVPTRELALQIETFWKQFTRFAPELRCACIIGGASFGPQLKALAQNPRLIIATPGRLVDHLNQRKANLSNIAVLILDEADRMLDMGFAPQLNQVLRFVPKKRQTFLFSATWPTTLNELAKKYLVNPTRIAVGTISKAAITIEQATINTTVQRKNDTLLDEINKRKGSILIFTRTQIRTERVAKYLRSYGLDVGLIHGRRTQAQRTAALSAFRVGKIRILVATDIAARGIDVSAIAHVINYDLPQVAEDYIHRIGRTGRAGEKGEAVSLLTPEDRPQWQAIARLLQKTGSVVPASAAVKPAHKVQARPTLSSRH